MLERQADMQGSNSLARLVYVCKTKLDSQSSLHAIDVSEAAKRAFLAQMKHPEAYYGR